MMNDFYSIEFDIHLEKKLRFYFKNVQIFLCSDKMLEFEMILNEVCGYRESYVRKDALLPKRSY